MLITHKIELKPNNKQRTYFVKACGVSRFTWNWALAEWQKQYDLAKNNPGLRKPNGLSLKKLFNAIKKEQFPWIYEVTKYASQQPFIYLQRAFSDFFKGKSQRPKFKKKGRCKDSFYVGGDQVVIKSQRVKVPNLGWVRLRESLRFAGHIVGMTISRQADRWYVAFQVDVKMNFLPCKNQASVGVDLGINHLATLSTGEQIENQKPLDNRLRRLKRCQRQLSNRKQKGSNNYAKAAKKIAKLNKTIADKRRDILHKLSTRLTKTFNTIVIEDLNVKGMLSNHRLARHIADVGFYELRRQLTYKAAWYKNQLTIADRWFPSSKMCSSCSSINEHLTLADREYQCPHCNIKMDRDLNAAINLERLAMNNTESSSGIYALGQDGSVVLH